MGLRSAMTARRTRRQVANGGPGRGVDPDLWRPAAGYDPNHTEGVQADRPNVVRSDPGPRQSVNVQVPPTTPPVVGEVPVRRAVVYERDYTLSKIIQAIWLFVGFLEIMLAIRFLLRLLAANPENPFAVFTYGLTGPLVWPFVTLLGTPQVGGSVFEWYTLFAMVVYWLLAWLITKLIVLIWDRPVERETVVQEPVVRGQVVEERYHERL
jgi:YggT family protein